MISVGKRECKRPRGSPRFCRDGSQINSTREVDYISKAQDGNRWSVLVKR